MRLLYYDPPVSRCHKVFGGGGNASVRACSFLGKSSILNLSKGDLDNLCGGLVGSSFGDVVSSFYEFALECFIVDVFQ